MVRTVVYLLISIFLITLIRAFIGLIGKAFGQLFQPHFAMLKDQIIALFRTRLQRFSAA